MTAKKPSSHQTAADLYAREHERVSRFLRNTAHGTDDVENVVEETFSRLTAADKGDVIQDPERYLFTVAYDAVRAQEAGAELEAHVERDLLLAAVDALPESLRTPLLLSIRGMAHREIASLLGLSVSATRDRLVRARARLALCIEQVEA